MEFLVALGVVAGTMGIVVLVRYLQRKNLISSEDIQIVAAMFELSVDIIDELNLKEEEHILIIAKTVESSLRYAAQLSMEDLSEGEMEEASFLYAQGFLQGIGIETNEHRERIMRGLIDIGLNEIEKKLI